MPTHKERHILGGMHADPIQLLSLVHDGLEAAEETGREDLMNLSESVLSGTALLLRYRMGYLRSDLADRVELLESELKKLARKRLKKA